MSDRLLNLPKCDLELFMIRQSYQVMAIQLY